MSLRKFLGIRYTKRRGFDSILAGDSAGRAIPLQLFKFIFQVGIFSLAGEFPLAGALSRGEISPREETDALVRSYARGSGEAERPPRLDATFTRLRAAPPALPGQVLNQVRPTVG